MKKIIMLLGVVYFLGLQASAQAAMTEEKCAGGAGQVFIGNTNGKRYCVATKETNWFTAYTWCERNGWTMPSWKTHCPNATKAESGELIRPNACPNLKVVFEDGYKLLWLVDNWSNTHSVCIVSNSGSVDYCARNYLNGKRVALCAME